MITAQKFRRIALELKDATEGSHMGHPDFRVNGKIFATIGPDAKQGMVKLTPDQQQGFIEEYPDAFSPASGAWGRQGCTMVRFAEAAAAIVIGAMSLAWQNATAPKKAAKVRSRVRRAP